MKQNPKLHNQIKVHISFLDNDVRNLSLDRAKQVRRVLQSPYLLERRVKVKGFGVSKPKFPIPEVTEEQAAANRRVEIMILEK